MRADHNDGIRLLGPADLRHDLTAIATGISDRCDHVFSTAARRSKRLMQKVPALHTHGVMSSRKLSRVTTKPSSENCAAAQSAAWSRPLLPEKELRVS